jgi:DNA-binding response OmpR family regulator
MGNDTSIEHRDQLALRLHLLVSKSKSWLSAWDSLPTRLREVEQYLDRAMASQDLALQARAQEVQQIVVPLIREDKLSHAEIVSFSDQLAEQIAIEKTSPGYRGAGTLYSELHGRIENLINLLAQGLDDVAVRAGDCLLLCDSSEGQDELRNVLEQVSLAARLRSEESLRAAAGLLQALLVNYPLSALKDDYRPDEAHRRWLVIGVEDDPVWQEVIRRTVEIAKRMLSAHYEVEYEIYPDRQSGEKRLKQLAASHRTGEAPDTSVFRPLAVLDMGIPKTKQDRKSPSRDEGVELLKVVRSPAINAPAIVLTTSPNFLGDHLMAAGLGVSDYLLKGIDSEERILEAMTRIITVRQRRRLRVLEETGRLITVDDVQIALEPAVFRTVSVLASNAPRRATVNDIVNLLEDKYGGYRTLVAPTVDLPPRLVDLVNLRIHWSKAKLDAPNAVDALGLLIKSQFRMGQALIAELSAIGVDLNDEEAISGYMETNYGTPVPLPDEFDTKNIEKHIHEARKAIKKAFSLNGQTIFPEEDVIVNSAVDEEFAYKVVAQVHPEEDQTSSFDRFRILVVENDIPGWQDPITQLLRKFGYEVEAACCEAEAIATAHKFKPHLLSLDMHLPRDLSAFARDPFSGDAEAGLHILQSIGAVLPEVRSIVMTDHTDNDYIRDRLVNSGVRVTDFVSKRCDLSSPWEAELILKVHRIEREFRRQAILPLPDLPALPYIHLWESRKHERYVEVFDRYIPTTANRFSLLWLLASREGRPVPTPEVLLEVYGDVPGKEQSLKQLVKHLRDQIAKDWFGISEAAKAKRISEAVLANDAKAGWILNARVQIDP